MFIISLADFQRVTILLGHAHLLVRYTRTIVIRQCERVNENAAIATNFFILSVTLASFHTSCTTQIYSLSRALET